MVRLDEFKGKQVADIRIRTTADEEGGEEYQEMVIEFAHAEGGRTSLQMSLLVRSAPGNTLLTGAEAVAHGS